MDKGKCKGSYQEIISMEEYLRKRQIIKESQRKEQAAKAREKSPAWMFAGLYI